MTLATSSFFAWSREVWMTPSAITRGARSIGLPGGNSRSASTGPVVRSKWATATRALASGAGSMALTRASGSCAPPLQRDGRVAGAALEGLGVGAQAREPHPPADTGERLRVRRARRQANVREIGKPLDLRAAHVGALGDELDGDVGPPRDAALFLGQELRQFGE